jgi:hypothetical protein
VALTVITALIVVPGVLLLTQVIGGGDGSSDVTLPGTPHHYTDKKSGISVRWPNGWKLTRRAGGVVLSSKDRTTGLVIAASRPSTRRAARATLKATVFALSQTYRRPRVSLARNSRSVSGLPTETARIAGTRRKGGGRQITSVIIARGRRHVYLIEIIAPARGGRLGDVALISRRLRLSG